jgi:hypothetical protein
MTRSPRPIGGKKSILSGRWFVASLTVHVLMAVVVMLVADAHPQGRGTLGLANDESFSVTWIPGTGGGGGKVADTVIPDAEPGDSLELTGHAEMQSPAAKRPLLVETDPQDVFSAEAVESFTVDDTTAVVSKTDTKSSATAVRTTTSRPYEFETPISDHEGTSNGTSVSPRSNSTSQLDSNDNSDGSAGGLTGSGPGSDDRSGDGGAAGGGSNHVKFFGIAARGKRIVYVVDASESMRQHKAMEIARAELLRSLRGLESTAHFQIVFFDLKTHPMNKPGERPHLLRANASNVRLAEHFVKGIQPDAGTDRFLAVTNALSFDPDVIFLLTDADDPEMSAKELFEILRGNKRKSSIHVVEFGIGADLSRDSFLKKLARQNAGTHRYRDLTKPQP